MAPKVRELCERYRLPYTSGPLYRQYADVLATIARLALAGGGPGGGGQGGGGSTGGGSTGGGPSRWSVSVFGRLAGVAQLRRAAAVLTTPLLPDDYLSMINQLWSARELRGGS